MEEELLHYERPKESAPKAHTDADAGQPGVTERAPELAGDWNRGRRGSLGLGK